MHFHLDPTPAFGSGPIENRYATDRSAKEWASEHGGWDQIIDRVAARNPEMKKFLKED